MTALQTPLSVVPSPPLTRLKPVWLTEERVAEFGKRVRARRKAPPVEVHTPLTREALATLPRSTPADVEDAFLRARRAQAEWAETPLSRRREILLKLHDLVWRDRDELLDLVQLESGKAREHAFEEVADVAIVARHYAIRGARYLAPKRAPGAYPVLTQSTESHLPKGVVGIVAPWNYPLSLAITDAIPAIFAGNAVVLRPDLLAPLCALKVVSLLDEAELPDGVLEVVLGAGSQVGQAVIDRADYVCFTGSTPTGRRVAASAADRLVGASLELGGKNSLYVAEDAQLERVIEGARRACFSSAGQLCISTERLLVHDKIYERFVPRFVAAVQEMKLGAALDWGYDMGSLVSQDQLDTITAHVDDARAKGAKVLAGGRPRPDLGPYFYEPTVLEGVTKEMIVRDEETFGPLVSIYRVFSDEEAIELANDTEYGLNASIFTRDVARARRMASKIRTGTVNINEGYAAAWACTGSSMGGMKMSGLGRRHGAEGILKYTEAQNVTVQRLLPIGPAFGLTDKVFADVLSVALRGFKAIRRP